MQLKISYRNKNSMGVHMFIHLKNPIEIHSGKSLKIKKDPEDGGVSSVDVLRNLKKSNEDVNKAIEIHSSNSLKLKKHRIDDELCKGKKVNEDVNKAIEIHSSNSLKLKKHRINDEGCNYFSSDSDYEDATIRSLKKFVGESDKKIKKKKKKDGKVGNVKALYARVSVNSIYGAVKSMNDIQKDCVRRIGFGSLLDMKTQSIPTKLCYFVVDSFDHEEMVIKSVGGNIPVKREDVNRVLGFPLGYEQISCLGVRDNRGEADMVFIVNFIILEEKVVWSRNEIKTFFNGPCEFLTLLYVDRIQYQLKFREIMELENGGFGYGVVADCDEHFESGSIYDCESDIQLKLQEIVSVFSKFHKSDVDNVSSSGSIRRKICFEDDSFNHQGKEIGKRMLNEDIPSFGSGIESELYTPKKPCLTSGHKMQEKSIFKGFVDSPVSVRGKNSHVTSSLSKRDLNQLPSKSRPKRDQMLPPVKRSPYVIRAVPIDTTLTKEENIISN
ncbi:unnamed protein product [Lactuca saligna]|uniref:Uncharacterized protein n=1 Tax=Lactuca saligna TaxID=75948 RepID=A0AA35Y9W1_LACSI|nr:unnamed protein product [Lactuca saligna]